MTGVAHDSAILHIAEGIFGDNISATGNSNKEITDFSGFFHLHDLEAIHNGFHCLDWINLCDNNGSAQDLGTHGNALAAPTITGNHNIFTSYDQVGGTVDTVPNRLTGTITVIEQMLAVCVVHQYHWEFQLSCLIHRQQAQDTGGGFLTAANDIFDFLRILGVQQIYQIAAVINDDVGTNLYYTADMLLVLLLGGIVPCVYIQTVVYQRSRYVVLCRKRIAAGNIHFCAAGCQYLAQISGLCL